jgi:hypothetical protein
MTHPWQTEAYERWHSNAMALHQAYLGFYANIGPQTSNASRVAVLKHVRETRAQMSDAEAQDIWSACDHCDRCGCSISPGEPYQVINTSREGKAVDVLYCIDCAFEPNIVRVINGPPAEFVDPRVQPHPSRVRAAVSATQNEVHERWMRQDRLKHRGALWRFKRRARWWSNPIWALPPIALPRQPGLLQRLVAAWRLRRLRKWARRVRKIVWSPPEPGVKPRHKIRKENAARRVVARYKRGERRFVRAELAGVDLCEVNLEGADFSMADLTEALFDMTNLTSAGLVRADLERADLYRANLNSADLREANLFGAFLVRADLQGANLEGANMGGVNLYEALVTDGQLAKVFSLKGALLPDGSVHK